VASDPVCPASPPVPTATDPAAARAERSTGERLCCCCPALTLLSATACWGLDVSDPPRDSRPAMDVAVGDDAAVAPALPLFLLTSTPTASAAAAASVSLWGPAVPAATASEPWDMWPSVETAPKSDLERSKRCEAEDDSMEGGPPRVPPPGGTGAGGAVRLPVGGAAEVLSPAGASRRKPPGLRGGPRASAASARRASAPGCARCPAPPAEVALGARLLSRAWASDASPED
jgi:hypothetical protein